MRELLAQAGAAQGQPGQKARHRAVSLEAWFLLSVGNSDEVRGKTGRDFHLERLPWPQGLLLYLLAARCGLRLWALPPPLQ